MAGVIGGTLLLGAMITIAAFLWRRRLHKENLVLRELDEDVSRGSQIEDWHIPYTELEIGSQIGKGSVLAHISKADKNIQVLLVSSTKPSDCFHRSVANDNQMEGCRMCR